MHRRFSTLMRSGSSSASGSRDVEYEDDNESKSTLMSPVSGKADERESRVDNYYSRWSKSWKYRNTSSKVAVESVPVLSGGQNDQWKDYSFVVVRTIPRMENADSEYILKACKDVIESWPGISWNSDPLELEPQIFITHHQEFLKYQRALEEKRRTEIETNILSSVKLLNNTIAADYRTTLGTIERLTKHGEITFELLYGILVPRSLFVVRCGVTGLPRLLQLSYFQKTAVDGKPMYQLILESVDLVDRVMSNTVGVGRVQTVVYLAPFRGAIRITSLDAYPLKYHADEAGLREAVLKRGKKWSNLRGCGNKVVKHNVRSRIMVDRPTFRRLNPNYSFPTPVPPKVEVVDPTNPRNNQYDAYGNYIQPPQLLQATGAAVEHVTDMEEGGQDELTDEDPPADPSGVEFNIELIEDVEWNNDAFSNLVLPAGRKDLLQSLVEAHHREIGFDDFIKGKGHGLVINLYGPPGVGKTFSAEATSEHVKRPLYIVGAGDLGTRANELDAALERVFDVATAWKAIVLIDEADVFLEQRSLHDLERNAMVAVFLRHVEYYRGILFLTTNRVKTFDEAFLSRIHVALHFQQLSQESKEQVWAAFIKKAGASDTITPQEITTLARRDINGRQIKNAVRTAHSLAVGRDQDVKFEHIEQTLDAMAEFNKEFENGSR
ncbi:P-loop containing nucleoside triphosphate hydrolase protein [Ephemerocybe angulata]|uniref:P-loop containing nucleoside triphosphate hydrolase protein n=1 Tax=Ephemerocybe angulata TaxID=980116 RepID=A0A8H6I7F4_9AGAR|nr:P-loop containing nucleoside triphosphate hydrolase protein [Tulosesus angulatus]